MIKTLLILSIFSFGHIVQLNSCSKNEVPTNDNVSIAETKIDSKTVTEKFLTIRQLNERKPSEGIFETRGFVAKIYTCPPCPPDAQCKPCMGDNIVISEENKNLDSYELTEKEMIIFTDLTGTFSKNKEYKFKVKIIDSKTTSANLNDAKLISSVLIKN